MLNSFKNKGSHLFENFNIRQNLKINNYINDNLNSFNVKSD